MESKAYRIRLLHGTDPPDPPGPPDPAADGGLWLSTPLDPLLVLLPLLADARQQVCSPNPSLMVCSPKVSSRLCSPNPSPRVCFLNPLQGCAPLNPLQGCAHLKTCARAAWNAQATAETGYKGQAPFNVRMNPHVCVCDTCQLCIHHWVVLRMPFAVSNAGGAVRRNVSGSQRAARVLRSRGRRHAAAAAGDLGGGGDHLRLERGGRPAIRAAERRKGANVCCAPCARLQALGFMKTKALVIHDCVLSIHLCSVRLCPPSRRSVADREGPDFVSPCHFSGCSFCRAPGVYAEPQVDAHTHTNT